MLFSLHIFPSSPECCTCQAYSPFDILLTPSIRRYQSSQIDKSRALFQHPCSQSHLQFLVLFSYCHRFCFSAFINSPILLLLLSTLFVRSCRFSFMSAIKSMSSTKRRLFSSLPLSFTPVPLPSFSANLITISSIRLNKSGDSPHPCLTPTLILNHSVHSPSIRTALMDLLYRSSINVTSSSGTPQYLITLHNPSCHTLSNACL